MIVSYQECALGAYKGCCMGTKEHKLSRIYFGCLKGVVHRYDISRICFGCLNSRSGETFLLSTQNMCHVGK